MRKTNWLASVAVVMTMTASATGQVVESAFVDGHSAFVAFRQPGLTFALNPAALGTHLHGRQHRVILEGSLSHYPDLSAIDFPDFELVYQSPGGLTVALRKSVLVPRPVVGLRRIPRRPPGDPLPFPVLEFHYRQDWSVGVGATLDESWTAGLAFRRELYLTFPTEFSYWIADLAVQWQRYGWLRLGAIVRNLAWKQAQSGVATIAFLDASGEIRETRWDPTVFTGAATGPRRSLEAGVWLWPLSRWQLLFDVSSRGEYAWGIRWRVAGPVHLVGGEFHRYDRIFDGGKIIGNSVGLQVLGERFGLAFSAVFPTKKARSVGVRTPYGDFEVSQAGLKTALLGLYFVF